MKNLHLNEIKKLWKENKFPIAMYIHSLDKNNYTQEEFNAYYNEYLPNMIKEYNDVINSNKISSIYFGGGAPNIGGKLHQLDPIFASLKNINAIERVIELHMGYEITDEQIKYLADNHINTVILCQQTFSNEALKKVNRINGFKNNLEELIKKFHAVNINVGMDLMYLSNNEDIDYRGILQNDLNLLYSLEETLDEISIYRDISSGIFEDNDLINIISRSNLLTKYLTEVPLNILNTSPIKSFRIYSPAGAVAKSNNLFYSFTPAMDEINGLYSNTPISILGIGSYKNRSNSVFSSINKSINYYEINDNFNKEPYFISNNYVSYYDQIINLVNWMRTTTEESLPIGAQIQLSVRPTISNNNSAECELDFKNQPMISFNIYNCPQEYIDKLNDSQSKIGTESILLKENN